MSETPTTRGSRARRILKWTGIIVLALVVVWQAIMWSRSWFAHSRAVEESQEAYASRLPIAHRWREDVRSSLEADFGPPTASRQELSCYVVPVDQGWFVADHRYICDLTLVEVFAGADPTETAALLDSIPDADAMFGTERTHGSDGCVNLRQQTTSDGDGIALETMVQETPDSGSPTCRRVLEPSEAPGRGVSRDVATEGEIPATVTDGAPVLILQWRTRVSNEGLGCHPISVMFCNEPPFTQIELPQ